LGFGILWLAACTTPTPTPASPIRLAATDLAEPLLADLVTAYQAAHPEAAFITDFVPLSTLNAELSAGRWDAGLTSVSATAPFATPIGYAPFTVVVHPSNSITSLSAAQLRTLLAGRIADWVQVGGTSGPIQVVVREDGSDGARAFASALGGDMAIASNALIAPTWEAMRTLISQNPNALGYLPRAELNVQVKAITLDAPLRALVVAVAPAEPQGATRDFLAWAQSEAGQTVVKQKYEGVK